MKITEDALNEQKWVHFGERQRDVPKYAAEHGIADEEALKKNMEEKSREFWEKGVEVYARA